MTRREPPPAQDTLPVEAPPPEAREVRLTAGLLVRAWCDGYSAAHGESPHPRLIKIVSGVCARIAKDCETTDHWRTAWRAASAAGRKGSRDVELFLAGVQPRSLYAVKGAVSTREALVARMQRTALPGQVEQ